ncbi:hypothetical protein CYMTET_19686 [Cymbomonas tetramitiformis]|uniref:Glycoside hydrolase family 2 catalytic domain-containing protein n=1 Tax=Cymbomonas tetramitiformis TaxID=36881 RepID=A0AAE0G5H4_9CHLO|nr:hypothetical protein CYMTET_19686 [Cymbomonas tetramitiformis]
MERIPGCLHCIMAILTALLWQPVHPTIVTTDGREIFIDGEKFFMRGMAYSPAPIGQYPKYQQPLGDFFTPEYAEIYTRDLLLLKGMGCNSVRLYASFENEANHTHFLDTAYENGIYVQMSLELGTSHESPVETEEDREVIYDRIRQLVRAYKDHPAVLLWILGNEINGGWNSFYRDLGGGVALLEFVEQMCVTALEEDPHHPTTTCFAEIPAEDLQSMYNWQYTPAATWAIASRDYAPSMQLITFNLYRGNSFGDIFNEIAYVYERPLLMLEWGMDSWDAKNNEGMEETQASYLADLWNELEDNQPISSGGAVMAYQDEWWKGDCPAHACPPCTYSSDFDAAECPDEDPWTQSPCGYNQAAFPDSCSDEEHYGIFATERRGYGPDTLVPKPAYYTLCELWTGAECSAPSDDLLSPVWEDSAAPDTGRTLTNSSKHTALYATSAGTSKWRGGSLLTGLTGPATWALWSCAVMAGMPPVDAAPSTAATTLLLLAAMITQATSAAAAASVEGHRLLVDGEDFFVKGVVYRPVLPSEDPDRNPPYGDYYTREYSERYAEHLKDIHLMGANLVHTEEWALEADHGHFLDAAASYDLKVMPTFWMGDAVATPLATTQDRDYVLSSLRNAVRREQHSAILMWAVGVDMNANWTSYLQQSFGGEVRSLFSFINAMCEAVRAEGHLCCVPLADADFLGQYPVHKLKLPGWVEAAEESGLMTALDVWGANVDRGGTFDDLFGEFAAVSARPLLITKFQSDAYDSAEASESAELQAAGIDLLFDEIWMNTWANPDASGEAVCAGGIVNSFSDAWHMGGTASAASATCPEYSSSAQSACGHLGGMDDNYTSVEYLGLFAWREDDKGDFEIEAREAYDHLQAVWREIGQWEDQTQSNERFTTANILVFVFTFPAGVLVLLYLYRWFSPQIMQEKVEQLLQPPTPNRIDIEKKIEPLFQNVELPNTPLGENQDAVSPATAASHSADNSHDAFQSSSSTTY